MLVVPSVSENFMIQLILNREIFLRLYSNDVTPDESSILGDFTQVVGGGYVQKSIGFGDWIFTAGDPTNATLYSYLDFIFTGPTTAPSTVYGYYMVAVTGELMWAERFAETVLPYIPVNNSLIRITPKFLVS